MKKQYFPILNSIRGIAALTVLVHHLILYLKKEGIEYPIPYFFDEFLVVGKYGVQIFFTLSGFLIGGNLFVEQANNKSNVSNFIRNRILRIWPLYFVVLFLSLTILPLCNEFEIFHASTRYANIISQNDGKYGQIMMYAILFLPNYLINIGLHLPGFTQAWSIGVEEQFYLLIPWLFKSKRSALILSTILLLVFVSHQLFGNFPFIKSQLHHFINLIIGVFFGCMRYLIKPEYNAKGKGYLIVFGLIILFSINFKLFHYHFYLLSISLGVLVFLSSYFNSKEKITSYFGKYSYGIYMYHPMIMYLTLGPLLSIYSGDFFPMMWMGMVSVTTLLISITSYKYLENPALKLKKS